MFAGEPPPPPHPAQTSNKQTEKNAGARLRKCPMVRCPPKSQQEIPNSKPLIYIVK